MTPFFFGSSAQQLFGAYDSPPGGGRRGAVVCYPWAREYFLAYPTMRHLARKLSDVGWHVLRFDYFGTGDSAGESEEATNPQWLRDIETAVDELKDMAQLSRITLIGMRYGAALAAQVAATRRDIDRLVLWDPVFNGREYLTELGAPKTKSQDEVVDVKGAVLTSRVRREMEALTVGSFGTGIPPTLILNTLDDGSAPGAYRTLQASLSAAGIECEQQHVPDIQAWREEWGTGGVGIGAKSVARLVSWLS